MADRGGFDEFVATRTSALLRTAYLLTADHGLAEDLLQTALAKSWFAWGRIDGPPEPYVRRVLVTTYATWWRRRWRAERPTEQLPDRPAVEEPAVEDRDALWRALDLLPRRQRAVVVLRYYEDLSEAETADALGISRGTVKSQASRALAALRRDADLISTMGGGQ
jgi:RNA polymerase sigma-70 factor (sigma-E family)